MKCKICQQKAIKAFKTKILRKYLVTFFKCPKCGFIFSETPYWLDESYSEAINLSDTGIMMRNIRLSKIASCVTYFIFGHKSKILDWGGGMVYLFDYFAILVLMHIGLINMHQIFLLRVLHTSKPLIQI